MHIFNVNERYQIYMVCCSFSNMLSHLIFLKLYEVGNINLLLHEKILALIAKVFQVHSLLSTSVIFMS